MSHSAAPWTVAHQAPLSMGFSRQGYWSGLKFPSPGDLPNPGIEPRSPALQIDALPSEPPGSPQGELGPSNPGAWCRSPVLRSSLFLSKMFCSSEHSGLHSYFTDSFYHK